MVSTIQPAPSPNRARSIWMMASASNSSLGACFLPSSVPSVYHLTRALVYWRSKSVFFNCRRPSELTAAIVGAEVNMVCSEPYYSALDEYPLLSALAFHRSVRAFAWKQGLLAPDVCVLPSRTCIKAMAVTCDSLWAAYGRFCTHTRSYKLKVPGMHCTQIRILANLHLRCNFIA